LLVKESFILNIALVLIYSYGEILTADATTGLKDKKLVLKRIVIIVLSSTLSFTLLRNKQTNTYIVSRDVFSFFLIGGTGDMHVNEMLSGFRGLIFEGAK